MIRSLVLLALLLPLSAHADRGEIYTFITVGPAVLGLDDPANGTVRQSRPGLLGELAVYSGLSHTLYVGGLVRGSFTRDVAFQHVTIRQQDGGTPTGTLYADTWNVGVGPLVAYRYDTGYRLAPLARFELTGNFSRYQRLQLAPTGTSVALDFPAQSDFAVSARLLALAEYRLTDRFIVSAGLGIRRSFGSLTVWEFDVPVSLGAIW
ncbi:hypothetical protein [Myxococcus vastator]|uniref:hypothetical protein n=1 Tax=Myxococcus vastator TaxID=2709664 RepID=UPI0013D24F46|nr:hypothetical protein [Myxococcus vastator]